MIFNNFFNVFKGFYFDEILRGTPPLEGSDYLQTPPHLVGVGAEEAVAWYDKQVQALSWLRGISYSIIILGSSPYGNDDRLSNTHLEVLRQLSVANPEDPAGELNRLVEAGEIVFVKKDKICYNSCNGIRCSFGEDGKCKFVGCGPKGSVFWGKVPASGFPVTREQYQLIKDGTFVDLYCESCVSNYPDEESVQSDRQAQAERSAEVQTNGPAQAERSAEMQVKKPIPLKPANYWKGSWAESNDSDSEDEIKIFFGSFEEVLPVNQDKLTQLQNEIDKLESFCKEEKDQEFLMNEIRKFDICLEKLESIQKDIGTMKRDIVQELKTRISEPKNDKPEVGKTVGTAEQELVAEKEEQVHGVPSCDIVEDQLYFPKDFMPDDHAILKVFTEGDVPVKCTVCEENGITITGFFYRQRRLFNCAISVGQDRVIFNENYKKPPRCWSCQNIFSQSQRQTCQDCKVVPFKRPSAEELAAFMDELLEGIAT